MCLLSPIDQTKHATRSNKTRAAVSVRIASDTPPFLLRRRDVACDGSTKNQKLLSGSSSKDDRSHSRSGNFPRQPTPRFVTGAAKLARLEQSSDQSPAAEVRGVWKCII